MNGNGSQKMETGRLAVAALLLMLLGGGCASTSSRDVIAHAGQPYPLRLQLLEPAPENTTLHLGLVDVSELIGGLPRANGSLSALKIMPTSSREASGLSSTDPVVLEGKTTADVTFTPLPNAFGKNYLITIGLGEGSEAKLAGVISVVVGKPDDGKPSPEAQPEQAQASPQPEATPPPKNGQAEVKTPIGKKPRPRVKTPIGGGKRK